MSAIPEIAATVVFVVGLTTVLVCWLARGGAAQDSGLSVLDEDPTEDTGSCPGPLVWFDVADGALLECHTCGYVLSTGNFHDDRHSATPVMREGLAA